MASGKFIVIEGGEGSGKSVCFEHLKQVFKGRNDIVFIREPAFTNVGERVRKILKEQEMCFATELLLYCAIQTEIKGQLIDPTIKSEKHVILEKISHSTESQQIYGRNYTRCIFAQDAYLDWNLSNMLNPDFVIYLDVDPKVGLARKKIDDKNLKFHAEIRRDYINKFRASCTSISRNKKPTWYMIPTTDFPEEAVKRYITETIEHISNL